jgi:hypothetical protein
LEFREWCHTFTLREKGMNRTASHTQNLANRPQSLNIYLRQREQEGAYFYIVL